MTELISADRAEIARPGRPMKHPGEPIVAWPRIGMTKKQQAKVKKNGGPDWVRKLIEEAP